MDLFVYGTLRPAHGHPLGAELLRESEGRGKATVVGRLYDCGEYPVAVRSDDRADVIVGEIYCLPSAHRLWSVLDDYEAYYADDLQSSYFERVPVEARRADAGLCQVQIYWYLRSVEGMRRIAGGDYFRRATR